MPSIDCFVCSCIMPAIASEPPEGISTTVSALRVRIDGMVSVLDAPLTESVIELSVDKSETSVMTLRLIRPSESTTGVKVNATPNFLKSTCDWQTGGDLVVSQE